MAFEESELMIPELEREENLIAAARHVVRALGSKKNLTGDAKKILADLGTQLRSISIASSKEKDLEDRLNAIEEVIMNWEEDQSEYLNAADETRRLIEKLESSTLSKEDKEYKLLHRAYSILQTAMSQLEQVFKNLLSQNTQPFEPEYVSFRSEGDFSDENSVVSFGDESVESFRRDSINDPVSPDVILHLRCIASLMFASGYRQECCHAYTMARREALEQCLAILEIEKQSIENVLRMEWTALNSKIKRWIWGVRIFVRVYLASEKWLADRIFGEGEPVSQVCFVDASKSLMLQLLNFAGAVSIGPRKPEKLFKILDMYEVLSSLVPEVTDLYQDKAGSSVRFEFLEAITGLGDCVKATFLEFEHAIASDGASTPFVGGGIHPLTRYVMNYLETLTDYGEKLNHLLKDKEETEEGKMARHFRSVASILEFNLDEKSKLYKDVPLQHLFLVNNIQYMARKVKGSDELGSIFGDDWIRKRKSKYRQHAMNYQRHSLSPILSFLKDDGIQMQGTTSNVGSKNVLKDKLRSFYIAFEDLYRVQTAWNIPDIQLREELRIALSLKVVQAYRQFVGRHGNQISEKHVKYSAEDLEAYILDFFEGAAKSLQSPRKK
ncbi:exocyst complex component EXO70E2-like [Arachis duranensis]|uniref:Exocyst subunit Exo70 family protein n=1 Tax=Arachis duranensis TaxID=130453 RepID=A0A6P4CA24_ARADU|nr:exocyst complex component EXO70E2-like [Arachis duranensis]